MFENEINESVNNFAYRLQSQGLDIETYVKYRGMTPDALREQFREQSEKNVKIRLALEKITELEGITASDDEIEAEYDKLAKAYDMKIEEVKNVVDPKQLAADVKNEKAVALVRESAVITVEE